MGSSGYPAPRLFSGVGWRAVERPLRWLRSTCACPGLWTKVSKVRAIGARPRVWLRRDRGLLSGQLFARTAPGRWHLWPARVGSFVRLYRRPSGTSVASSGPEHSESIALSEGKSCGCAIAPSGTQRGCSSPAYRDPGNPFSADARTNSSIAYCARVALRSCWRLLALIDRSQVRGTKLAQR